MKVRRRPIILDAEQFTLENPIEGVLFFQGDGLCCIDHWYIPTLEGDMTVRPGDFIITGIAGEKWPIKSDIFWETYEKLEEEGC